MNPLLPIGQVGEQRRTLGHCLGYLVSGVLIAIAGFTVYLGKKLLGVAGQVKGGELVTLRVVPLPASVTWIIHK
jgi:hypothetical protein